MIAELLQSLLVLKVFLWLASCIDVRLELSTQIDGELRDLIVVVSERADGPDFADIFREFLGYGRQMEEKVNVG